MRIGRIAVMLTALAMFAMPASAFAQQTAPTGAGNQDNDVVLDDVGSPVVVGDDNSVNTNANVNNNSQTVNVGGAAPAPPVVVRRPVVHRRFFVRRAVHPIHRRTFFVRRVALARTGVDAWMIALLGGLSLAGGLAARRGARRVFTG